MFELACICAALNVLQLTYPKSQLLFYFCLKLWATFHPTKKFPKIRSQHLK